MKNLYKDLLKNIQLVCFSFFFLLILSYLSSKDSLTSTVLDYSPPLLLVLIWFVSIVHTSIVLLLISPERYCKTSYRVVAKHLSLEELTITPQYILDTEDLYWRFVVQKRYLFLFWFDTEYQFLTEYLALIKINDLTKDKEK